MVSHLDMQILSLHEVQGQVSGGGENRGLMPLNEVQTKR